jgi:hypothetical protein
VRDVGAPMWIKPKYLIEDHDRHGNVRIYVCAQYYQSALFRQLDPTTQIKRRRILEGCCDEKVNPESATLFGVVPVSKMTTAAIETLRDR